MQRPFIHPYAYSVLIMLFTAITTAAIIPLLLFFHYYCCYKTVAIDNLCQARLFPGASELTIHLLRLTNILWLPLCRINKLGFTSREDCYDPLYLWVIKTIFWRHCRGHIALLISSSGEAPSSSPSSQASIKKVVPTIFRRHLQLHLGSTLHLSPCFYCFLFCLVYFCLVYFCLVCFCFVFFCLVCFCFCFVLLFL